MATFYLDLENGNDSNDGTTFANRWKTFTNGATAARIAPGDTIRIMASPDPTSLGQTAQWTNKSATVTLSSALTKTIDDCDSAWTPSTNVTHSSNTSIHRQGSSCRQLAIASAFTTGKIAYRDLGTAADFSGYRQIMLWFRASTSIAASTLSLKLCSDSTGDTAVNSIVLPAITSSNVLKWLPVVVDTGGALGSSIRSVALYADADPGTVTLQLDNIEAGKDPAADDALTLRSLISKNADDGYGGKLWWPIRSILGTTVILETCTPETSLASTNPGFYGTTENVTTYKREPIVLTSSGTTTLTESGSAGNYTTYSGGWDRTAMSSQNGQTWIDMRLLAAANCFAETSRAYVQLEKLRVVGGATAFNLGPDGPVVLNDVQALIAPAAFRLTPGELTNLVSIGGEPNSVVVSGNSPTINTMIADTRIGLRVFSCNAQVLLALERCDDSDLRFFNMAGTTPVRLSARHMRLARLEARDVNQAVGGLVKLIQTHQLLIEDLQLHNPTWAYLDCGDGTSATDPLHSVVSGVVVLSGEITGPGSATPLVHGGGAPETAPKIVWRNLLLTSGAPSDSSHVAVSIPGGLYLENYNRVAGDHRFYTGGLGNNSSFRTDTSVRHTGSGYSWKFTLGSGTSQTAPLTMVLPGIYLIANQQATAKLWMRRDSVNITGRLLLRRGQLAGLDSDVAADISESADVWQEVVIQCTPTESGVVYLEVLAWGAVNLNLWIDDFSIVQAGSAPDFMTLDHGWRGQPFLGPAAASSGNGNQISIPITQPVIFGPRWGSFPY